MSKCKSPLRALTAVIRHAPLRSLIVGCVRGATPVRTTQRHHERHLNRYVTEVAGEKTATCSELARHTTLQYPSSVRWEAQSQLSLERPGTAHLARSSPDQLMVHRELALDSKDVTSRWSCPFRRPSPSSCRATLGTLNHGLGE